MSFAKAKIQRFNEIKACTPSPTKYHVATVQKKLKYGGFFSSKKARSPSCSDTGSIQSTPCFQTPNVPKKKKFLGLSASKSSASKSKTISDLEELKEKIVECNNKDAFIKELTEQIDDMKEKLSILEKENQQFNEIKLDYEQKIDLIEASHKIEFDDLNDKIIKVKSELQSIEIEYHKLKEENCLEIAELFSRISNFEDLFKKLANEHKKNVEQMQFEYCSQLQNNKLQHEKVVSELQTEIAKKSQKLEKLIEEKKQYELLISEKNAKIKQLEEHFQDVRALTEIQQEEKITEIENCWREKLQAQQKRSEAILRECQEISEYQIVQSEFEKTHLNNLLKEQQSLYNSLKCEYDEFVDKYKNLDVDTHQLDDEVSHLKKELKKIQSQKHAYEISLGTFKNTIEVLKRRLINSDRDVEQLKEELANAENKMLLYENEISELNIRLNEANIANEELEMQYESTSKLMQNQVKTIEKELLAKVDVLESQLKLFKRRANGEKELLNDVIDQHYEQQLLTNKAQKLIVESNNLISKLEADNNSLEAANLNLEMQLENATRKLQDEIEDGAEIRKKYIEKSGKYDELSHQFEQLLQELDKVKEKNGDLEKKVENMKKSSRKLKYTSADKENLASPMRTTPSSRVESSPGPLKEKN